MIYISYKKSIAINDQHIPFQDKISNKLVFDFIKDIKPDFIDILGDLIDFWQISKFLKDPFRKETLQDDIDSAKAYLQELRDISPDSEIILHYGNHLDRLRKYIWSKAPELSSIKSLDLKWMLDADKMKIKVIEEAEGYIMRGLLAMTHGTVVSQDSAMTARRNLQKYGLSVICGHTHRLGSTYKTDLRGIVGSWENGCLCDMNLVKQWGRELANWQTGFSIIFFKDDLFEVQQVPIIKGKFLFGEREYPITPETKQLPND